MSQTEFMVTIRWKLPHLYNWCKRKSFNEVMLFKNEFQRALATYAKTHKYDAIQEKALSMITKIDKWCRMAFIEQESIRIINGKPALASSPMTVKGIARQEWEKLNQRMSY